jgi:hypothetical protein
MDFQLAVMRILAGPVILCLLRTVPPLQLGQEFDA